MVETTGVYFEAYNYVLKTLQSTNPSALPFEKYLAPSPDNLALVSSLTREIALIEGPPGTGKTVVGVEIMKVLLAEENRKAKIGPILTICFTNHALDQFLEHLLDEKITNIVRLGSRTKSEKIKGFSLEEIHQEFIVNLSNLQRRHDEKRKEMCDIYDEGSRRALLSSDVIGMTTNGAAKFQNLIRSIGPRIIICEEAGEVLEAHILSALTPSTQHIILIGDPNQLRPKLATYSLSMDSLLGKNYQLDKSLFERLIRGDKAVKLEKAQLLTQRRMRKEEISDLIRYTLYRNGENTAVYRNLIDGENTAKYPNIRGAQHNVYFIDHRRPEDDSGDEFAMQSHANTYEVQMVVEMVKYFVRNGYNKPDDIAVLTPYLGQMIKIRDALAESFVVTLRTVDNFQGEEANIVIVSLVRNYSESGNDSIGFLKSPNRSNVLLSRARQGMFLIGNSELMASKSDMWARVIEILPNC
ncbi:18278_t:CDS:2 [Funneliformis geosporum]|nr:18278_t:CDS:2 [Funneliformis geosporum]